MISKMLLNAGPLFGTSWLAMCVAGADGHATWGFWKVFFVVWTIVAVVATGVSVGHSVSQIGDN